MILEFGYVLALSGLELKASGWVSELEELRYVLPDGKFGFNELGRDEVE